MKRRAAIFMCFLCVVTLAGLGCEFQQLDDGEGDNTADFSEFGGVSIRGEHTRGQTTDPIGPLLLDRLLAAQFSACFDILHNSDLEFNVNCIEHSIVESTTTGPLACRRKFCMSQLYRCTGFRSLDLSESVDLFEFSTHVFAFDAVASGDFIKVTLGGGGVTADRETDLTTYRIPPLSSEAKTLALLSANAMFRAAGIEAAEMVETSDGNAGTCIDWLYQESQGPQPPETETGSENVNLLDRYSLLITESLAKLVESTKLLAANQLNVGTGALSKYADRQKAQDQLWKGTINSQTAALRILVGDPAKKVELPGCRTELFKPSHRKAVDLLRTARLWGTFEAETSVSDDLLIKQLMCVLTPRRDTNGDLLPCNTAIYTQDDIDVFLESRGVSVEDVDLGRRYLNEEKIALNLTVSVDPTTNPSQVYAMAPQTGARPATYIVGKTLGAHVVKYTSQKELFRTYADFGTAPAMDYIRRALNSILAADENTSSPLFNVDQRQLMMTGSVLANSVVGVERIFVANNGTQSGSGVLIRVYGAKESDKFYIVKGDAGYRCLSSGTDAGMPCDYSDYTITPVPEPTFHAPSSGTPGPLDANTSIEIEIETGGQATEIYIMRNRTSDRPELLGMFDYNELVTPAWNVGVVLPVVRKGEVQDLVQTITTREPGDCSEPQEMCGDIGLPRDFVPPLENELTENNDQYENSWVHYLNLARDAANHADQLGEQLLNSGLEMDLRSEQAQRELEKICGGVFNLEPSGPGNCTAGDPDCDVLQTYIDENPAMAGCLPGDLGGSLQRLPFVTAGSHHLCIYRKNDTGAICGEDDGGPCPRVITSGECTLPDGFDSSVFEAIEVDKTLNIFQSSGPREADTSTCEMDVALLRVALLGGGSLTNRQAAFKQVIEGAEWITWTGISNIAANLGLEVDPLHHYTVKYGNTVLWTTRHVLRDDCPCEYPWKMKEPGSNICNGDAGEKIVCVREYDENNPDPSSHPLWAPLQTSLQGNWLDVELGNGADQGFAWNRMEWGRRMRSYLVALGALTGSIPKVRLSGWLYWGDESGYPASALNNDGTIPPGTEMYLQERNWADEPITCLVNSGSVLTGADPLDPESLLNDPDVGACHSSLFGFEMYRYEAPLDYNVAESSSETQQHFWNADVLKQFLAGVYPITGKAWRLRSPYVDDLVVTGVENADGVIELQFLEDDRNTSWQEDHNHDNDPYDTWPFEDHITPERFVDLLEFACKISNHSAGPAILCDASDPTAVPEANSKKDIAGLVQYLYCAANDIQRVSERIVIPNLPDKLVEGFQSNGLEGLYGEFNGDNLKALLAIEDSLRSLGSAAGNITTVLFEGAQELSKVQLAVENIEIQKIITNLQTARKIIQNMATVVQSFSGGGFGGIAQATATLYTVISALDISIGELEKDVLENQEEQAFKDAMLLFSRKMAELVGVFNGIKDAYSKIQANLATLDQNQNQAVSWWAMGMGLDGDMAGRVYPVNTVMRRRKNTIRIRYEEAAKRAKKLAYIARRAIEFRLGVDLSQMHNELTLVPAPSSWADRICDMQGFSYDRLREAYPEDEELLDPELQDSDSYAHWYIGDYVTLLSDFVGSYNIDFPFTDERDTAVISVRDDLMRARAPCEVPSLNMLYYSEDVGANSSVEVQGTGDSTIIGWTEGGCHDGTVVDCTPSSTDDCQAIDNCLAVVSNDTSSVWCSEDFCFGQSKDAVDTLGLPYSHAAERLRDTPHPVRGPDGFLKTGRTEDARNSGYFEQTVKGVVSGHYILSWWARLPTDAPQIAPYRVEVLETAEPGGALVPSVPQFVEAPPLDWRRFPIRFEVLEGQDLKIRVHPSDADDPAVLGSSFGDVWIWGMQLERINCPYGHCGAIQPNAFQSTSNKLTRVVNNCADYDGSVFRQRFTYKCICLGEENGICPEVSFDPESTEEQVLSLGGDNRHCFWEYPFEITLGKVESGELIPSNNINIGNFNYRHEALALNVVGTNVIQCEQPIDPASCYTNAFVPFTIEHQGLVEVKNHNRETMEFSMPIARVEHGKGLTAEVVVTNPITGTHNQLLTEYWKDGLKGRPLQGQYMLRIWDTNNIVWSAIEDIQIVWKYRYWTQMSGY
ncbi:MAG: hypothetical protein ABI333_11545 [bacterium]